MEDFTLGLALYDFVPVVLTGIAVFYIAAIVRAQGVPGHPFVTLAAALVLAAGLTKAIWKLIATLSGQDLVWLASLLFPLMAPGFALLAVGVWASRRVSQGRAVSARVWLLPVAVIAAVFAMATYRMTAGIERGWFMPVMSLASLSNIALTALLFITAWQRGRRVIAVLFTVNLAMVFALIPIAQMDSHSIAMHWLEQSLTAVGAAAFSYASYRLFQDFKARPINIEPDQGHSTELSGAHAAR